MEEGEGGLSHLEQHVLQTMVSRKCLGLQELLTVVEESVQLFQGHEAIPQGLQEGAPRQQLTEAVNQMLGRIGDALQLVGMRACVFQGFDEEFYYTIIDTDPQDSVSKVASPLTGNQIQAMKLMLERMVEEWKETGKEQPPTHGRRELVNVLKENQRQYAEATFQWMLDNKFLVEDAEVAGEFSLAPRAIMDLEQWLGEDAEAECIQRARQRISAAKVPDLEHF